MSILIFICPNSPPEVRDFCAAAQFFSKNQKNIVHSADFMLIWMYDESDIPILVPVHACCGMPKQSRVR